MAPHAVTVGKAFGSRETFFNDLKALVNDVSDIKAVINNANGIEITFVSSDKCLDFLSKVPLEWKVESSTKLEKVVTLSPRIGQGHTDVSDGVVWAALEKFGKVVAGRRLHHRECPNIENGVRQFRMVVSKDVPSSFMFGKSGFQVQYTGQVRACHKCGGRDHIAKECRAPFCMRCRSNGHFSKECTSKVKCPVCQEEGHAYAECPKSLALEVKLGKSWGGISVTPKEALGAGSQDADPGAESQDAHVSDEVCNTAACQASQARGSGGDKAMPLPVKLQGEIPRDGVSDRVSDESCLLAAVESSQARQSKVEVMVKSQVSSGEVVPQTQESSEVRDLSLTGATQPEDSPSCSDMCGQSPRETLSQVLFGSQLSLEATPEKALSQTISETGSETGSPGSESVTTVDSPESTHSGSDMFRSVSLAQQRGISKASLRSIDRRRGNKAGEKDKHKTNKGRTGGKWK